MPVVEVMPSLVAGQAYEARVWIVPHQRHLENVPKRVRWSCGPKFDTVQLSREVDEHFCAVFSYWGPMLVQAELEFQDGTTSCVYVYARLPIDYTERRS